MQTSLKKYISYLNPKLNSSEFFWLFNALVLTYLSRFSLKNFLNEELIPHYLIYLLVYLVIVFLIKPYLKNEEKFPLRKIIFIIGSLVICFSEPLFENDHYRYLWEGKVLWHGYNPYLIPSTEIADVFFEKKEVIGFPELTSIYPPLALFFLALFSWLPYKVALTLFMLVNSWFSWIILNFCWNKKASSIYLILMIPFLQKEFIQSIHLDLLGVILLLIIPLNYARKSFPISLAGIFMGSYIKILSLVALPTYILARIKKDNFKKLFVSSLIGFLPLLGFYLFLTFKDSSTGVNAFSSYWVWSPGFYAVLIKVFGLTNEVARLTSFGIFLFVYLIVHGMAFRDRGRYSWDEVLTMIFSSMIFFSPVVNTWYFIWIFPFAWRSGSLSALLYIFCSQATYIPQLSFSYSTLTETIVHLPYIGIALSFFLKRKSVK